MACTASGPVVVQGVGSRCSFGGFEVPSQQFGTDAGRFAASCWSKHHQNGSSNSKPRLKAWQRLALHLCTETNTQGALGALLKFPHQKHDSNSTAPLPVTSSPCGLGGGTRSGHERDSKKESPPWLIHLSDDFTIA